MSSPKIYDTAKAENFKNEFENLAKTLQADKYCVVGIDILGYSQYEFETQAIIPPVFKILLDEVLRHLVGAEYFLFHSHTETDLRKKFISTGDGGFLVLENPLQGLICALKFASILHLFNSYSFYPSMRKYLGELKVRYCLTYNSVFEFESNFFGSGLINNARIMSRDKLDRCLMDKDSYTWFLEKINGLESLQIFDMKEISVKLGIPIPSLPKGPFSYSGILNTPFDKPRLRAIVTQKIGSVKAKAQLLDVYNLFVQVSTTYLEETTHEPDNYVVNLGNLNTVGIAD